MGGECHELDYTDFQQACLETLGSELNPTILVFENVETLLKVLTEDVIQLDYYVDDIVVSLKADKSSRATIPTQEVPEDNLVQVVVGEIFYPAMLHIDLLDMFYAQDNNSSELCL